MFYLKKQLRFPIGEIELHGDENESKKETVEKNLFLIFFWKSLKQTVINWNL